LALDPQAQAFLGELAELGVPRYGEQPVEVARRAMEEGAPALFGPFEPVPYHDRDLRGPHGPIPTRIYQPTEKTAPVLVYFHGGGWVLGGITTAHAVCATLARASGCVVASVDYRLAPEHRYPAAVDDAWAATRWIAEHPTEVGGSGKLAVGGDSAGGNLAAVVAVRAREVGMPLELQLLVYPVTDADLDTLSYNENAEGYWLTRQGMAWFWDQYIPEGDRFQPEASPLRAPDLTGVAPALVITAEYDPLRDEGEAYAERLAAAGVPVTLSRYDGLIHGFFRLPAKIDRANDALQEAASALRRVVGDPEPATTGGQS
jgi:acetyl esterase/lipase